MLPIFSPPQGLFDPNNPAVKLEPDRPVHVILDRMGVWSAEWHMRTSRYVRYNITVSSVLSSIGIFMRRSTMPTIVRYDIFDRISGRTLQPTARPGRRLARTARAIADQSAPVVYRPSSSVSFPGFELIVYYHHWSHQIRITRIVMVTPFGSGL